MLNGPTNDQWLNPWYDYLTQKGVKYHKAHEGIGFALKADNSIDYARVKNQNGEEIKVQGDYYILCAPVERAVEIIDEKMNAVDDQFQFLGKLAESTAWMNGIQFYLNEDVQIAHGHVCHSYTEWAITSISQAQFWKDYDLNQRYNGKVKDERDRQGEGQQGGVHANDGSMARMGVLAMLHRAQCMRRQQDSTSAACAPGR